MTLLNSRAEKPLRASRAYRFFGRDRETINEAYAGDILGLVNPGQFLIGDTLHTGAPVTFSGVPRFPAEHFGRARLQDQRYKQFDDGLRQLEEENSRLKRLVVDLSLDKHLRSEALRKTG